MEVSLMIRKSLVFDQNTLRIDLKTVPMV